MPSHDPLAVCVMCGRMNKIHDYGAKLEDPTSLGVALNRQGLGTYGASAPA